MAPHRLERLLSHSHIVLGLIKFNLYSAQFDDDGTFDPTVIRMDRFREPNMFERRRSWSTQVEFLESEEVDHSTLSVLVRYALRVLVGDLWKVEVKAFSVALILLVVWNILGPAISTAWTLLQVDVDLAIDSTCERPYAQAFCRQSCTLDWISTTFPICCSGRQSDIASSSKKASSSKVSVPTILERLEGHKESCKRYQDIVFPSIKDDLEATTAYKTRLLDTYIKLCRSLDHLPGELMSYYMQVIGNATAIYKYAREAQNYTQEAMSQLSPPKIIPETKAIQKYFSEAIPIEGDTIASLKRERGRIQWQFEKLRFDSGNLKRDLKDTRAQTLEKKSTATAQLQRTGGIAVQTGHEPAEVQRYTKAIEVLDEWYAETNALELLLMHIDSDVESLQKLVNGLVEKRLSTRVGELFGKAELQEMQPLLTWMREDARRIHEVARRSKIMRGWKQRPESGRVMESLREGGGEGDMEQRLTPWS